MSAGRSNQFAKARDLIRGALCYIPDTVILETAWVLQSNYDIDTGEIVRKLSALLGLPTIRVNDPHRLRQALTWYADGLDFADALHLAACQHLSDLKTVDQHFINRAAGKGTCIVEHRDSVNPQSLHSSHN